MKHWDSGTSHPSVSVVQGLRIGVIRNPRSHRNRRAPPDWSGRPDISVAVPQSKAAIEEALTAFAAQGIDVLMIEGGDGTVRDVLTRGAVVFGERWPLIAMVPKGKTNALALDLELPSHWTFDEAVAAASRGRTVRRRPVVIECEDRERALWGFIFGAGAFNAAIETGQVAHRFGAFQSFAIGLTAVFGLVQALFGIGNSPWRRTAPMRVRDEADGAELEHSGHGSRTSRYVALFSTLRRFPLGITPFRESDQGMRYLLLDAPVRRVTWRIPSILLGIEGPNDPAIGIHRGVGEAFRIDLDGRFILDGESFGPSRMVLRQGPELEFVVP